MKNYFIITAIAFTLYSCSPFKYHTKITSDNDTIYWRIVPGNYHLQKMRAMIREKKEKEKTINLTKN